MQPASAPQSDLLSLPPPDLGDEDIAALAFEHYRLAGRLSRLTSERDLNVRLTTAEGDSFVLKLSHPAEPPATTAFQTRALQHVARRAPGLPVPRLVATSISVGSGSTGSRAPG
ncbi:MAG: phosphotransferase [Tabrizicola sp.]|nr:phosphotransferase [Tabrizicola sp.]